ncbi:rhodanese-like domain-containing protein 4, chloroplastic [Heracleum sosnowskyi]|uniref:Rhodanese-like domain-containing protein 4, chloroplastic n=1 Tax=Heracleum sosnowskyi TaxID=360622 RepID=A0AAD8I027_9APIA|nr:rhodanese-like domain-containing protein 4, chloroplastic [Heracleum sosnowskyi]
MEALNAVGLTSISVLSSRRTKPKKITTISSLKSPFSLNFNSTPQNVSESTSRNFQGGLVFLSSVLSSGYARALTYEEALQQSTSTGSPSGSDVAGILDGLTSFLVENPAVIAGGAAILAVPLILSQFFGDSKPWGIETAKNAYAKLAEDANAQLVDIRALSDLRQVGTPDIKSLSKKSVPVVYNGDDKPGFLKKLALKFKEPENTTLFVLDKFDGSSELVAELVTANGFKAAYAIKDGAEGPKGWMSSGLPWIQPKKGFSFDFSSLTDAIGEGSEAVSVALGVAAATGLSLLAYTEVETLLQVLGSAAIVQFLSKKLLFAEDRKQTFLQLDEFLTKEVAPKDLVDDIKQIGKAFLPSITISNSLPAPAEATPTAEVANSAPLKAETVTVSAPEVESAPAPEVESAPAPEATSASLPTPSRPLSPFPYYPDFKPPTSPRPSQP